MTYGIEDFFEQYENGNYTWCRDDFWGSTRVEMREAMHRANSELTQPEMNRFINVIFLP